MFSGTEVENMLCLCPAIQFVAISFVAFVIRRVQVLRRCMDYLLPHEILFSLAFVTLSHKRDVCKDMICGMFSFLVEALGSTACVAIPVHVELEELTEELTEHYWYGSEFKFITGLVVSCVVSLIIAYTLMYKKYNVAVPNF